jgi:hypothetical protein
MRPQKPVLLALVLTGWTYACGAPVVTAPTPGGYTWEQIAEPGAGAFPDEWTEGLWPMTLVPIQAFDGKLWMIGQTSAWSSGDGLSWTRFDKTDWGERISVAHAFFAGRLWMFGGMRYQTNEFMNDVWSSADGRRWRREGVAAWSPRKGQTVIPFRNKLWLFGGANAVTVERAPSSFLNDVWSSEDGIAWSLVTEAAPWTPRDTPMALVFHDRLVLIGGNGNADVWSTPDGVAWSRLVSRAPWGQRFDQGAAVFDDQLWVYGGRAATPTTAFHDVWRSSDGETWIEETPSAPWSERSGVHSIVYRERLWLFSSKHTGSSDSWSGDIWTMRQTR